MELLEMKQFEPSEDDKARGMTVKNCCQCRICGNAADRFGEFLECQSNAGHVADARTGLFVDQSECFPIHLAEAAQ